MCDLISKLRDSPMLDLEFKKTKIKQTNNNTFKKALMRRNCVTLCSRPYKADYMMWPVLSVLLTLCIMLIIVDFFPPLSFIFVQLCWTLYVRAQAHCQCPQLAAYLKNREISCLPWTKNNLFALTLRKTRYKSSIFFQRTFLCSCLFGIIIILESAVCLPMIGTYNGSWRGRW